MTARYCRVCNHVFGLMPVGNVCVQCALAGKDGPEQQERARRVHARCWEPERFYRDAFLKAVERIIFPAVYRTTPRDAWPKHAAALRHVRAILHNIRAWTEAHILETASR